MYTIRAAATQKMDSVGQDMQANFTKLFLLSLLIWLRNHFTGESLDVRVLRCEIHLKQTNRVRNSNLK